MSQRAKFSLGEGLAAETTVSDQDAALMVDVLRVAWTDQKHTMITVASLDGKGPMYLNTACIQALSLVEIPEEQP